MGDQLAKLNAILDMVKRINTTPSSIEIDWKEVDTFILPVVRVVWPEKETPQ